MSSTDRSTEASSTPPLTAPAIANRNPIERLMAGRTSFVIAHRLSTLRNADRILVIDQGRLAGFAPHEDLLAGCEVYRRIWDAQKTDKTAVPENRNFLQVLGPGPITGAAADDPSGIAIHR